MLNMLGQQPVTVLSLVTNTINATATTAGTYTLTVTKWQLMFWYKNGYYKKISLLINGAAVNGVLVVVHPRTRFSF
jgi:hypothetical protein